MSVRWTRGEAEIDRLLREGHLQKVTGGRADGEPYLVRARTVLASAGSVLSADPGSAYVLSYDAARQACVGLLAQQGLRPTTRGGHIAVDQAVNAQFGAHFRSFGVLRKRRNELEYPEYPDVEAATEEADEALQLADGVIAAAERILPELGFF